MKTEEHSFNEEHLENQVKDTGFIGRLEITKSIGQEKTQTKNQGFFKRENQIKLNIEKYI